MKDEMNIIFKKHFIKSKKTNKRVRVRYIFCPGGIYIVCKSKSDNFSGIFHEFKNNSIANEDLFEKDEKFIGIETYEYKKIAFLLNR